VESSRGGSLYLSGNILLTEYAEESPAPVERVGPAVTPVRLVLAEDDVLLREGLAGPPC
jgi:hypothetical protein